jgi:hypothetical protein
MRVRAASRTSPASAARNGKVLPPGEAGKAGERLSIAALRTGNSGTGLERMVHRLRN